jgi:Sulfatase
VSLLNRWRTSTLATLDLFLLVGGFGIYLKGALLGEQWGAVARFLGKNSPQELSLLERLGFLGDDIVLNLLVVPLVATALLRFVSVRYRVTAAVLISAALSLLYYIELRAQKEVGQYISRDVLADLFGWSVGHPGMIRDYVSPLSLVKLALLLSAILAIGLVARLAHVAKQQRRPDVGYRYRSLLQTPVAVLLPAAALLAVNSLANRLPASPMNESAVSRAFVALTTTHDDTYSQKFKTFEETLDASRAQTRTARFDATHSLVGGERGADLLIFMMETGPAQVLDLARVGSSLPGTGPLYDRALVAVRHYTTHPYSSDAMYSILSGLYPQGRRRLLRGTRGRVNGLMTALQADVPVRRVYVPSLYNIELDARMYTTFGADTLYVSDRQPTDPLREVADRRAHELMQSFEASGSLGTPRTADRFRRRLRGDLQALERVKADITAAVNAGQRYSVLFFPEIGHAPWQPVHGERSLRESGRSLMLLQDAWLKELTDTVRSLGRLDQTVIAVTADHGIRTRAEDPSLPVGRISDYMFRVPLLVYAPQALKKTVVITTPTSHVDFAPTLAALLGRSDSVSQMQGVPIWQRTPQDRLYLLASAYGGADGFVQDGVYFMRQSMSGAVYRNSELSFDDSSQVPTGDPAIKTTADALADEMELQQALVTRLLRDTRP